MIIALVAFCLAQDAGNGGSSAAEKASDADPAEAQKSSNDAPVPTSAAPAPSVAPAVTPAQPASEAASSAPTAPAATTATAPQPPAAPATAAPSDPSAAPTQAASTPAEPDAPTGAADEAAPAPVLASLEVEDEPDAQHPRIAELSLLRVSEEDGWQVQDGRSRPVDARTWAILTGDAALLDRIAATRKSGRTLGWFLVGGGAAVAATSTIPLFTLEEALSTNESTPGFDEIGARNDARVATAFSLIGAGVILAGTGLVSHAIADKRALEVSRYLGPDEADASIRTYNRRLEDTLAPMVPAEKPSTELPEDLVDPTEADEPTEPEEPTEAAPAAAPAATEPAATEPTEPAAPKK